ncbi:MAG TPA: hypothetical protein VGK78_08420 [Nocardioides sp.]|uniref:hypothetical protein n=1 Tax=Nocardioides sp. TaxID=35761 RepID=UPI002F40F222
MLLRVAIILVGVGFVAYRVALVLEIRRAHRAGDLARERRLRTRGFGIYRWVLAAVVVIIVLLTALVWLNSR